MNAVKNYSNNTELNDIQEVILQRYLVLKDGRTKEEYTRNLSSFFIWLKKRLDQQIRPDTLAEYKIYLESKNLKTGTINTYLAPIKDFFKWAFHMDYMSIDVGKYLTVSTKDVRDQQQARSLTEDEIKALFKATSKDSSKLFSERIMLLCLFNLGMRISEIMGLRVGDVCLKRNTVSILGKGHKLRTLGLNSLLVIELKEYLDSFEEPLRIHDLLIQTVRKGKNDKPGTIQHGANVLKRTAKRADIDLKGIKSHSGRVTAINHLLDKETPIRDVANFAGHASVDTTRRYDRKDQEKIIETCNIIKFG